MSEQKLIFEYDNYREFLRDYYNHAKATNPKFSYRFFSQAAGFKSSSILKEVIDGKINIATNAIEKYVKALKLNNEEAIFFRHLVLLNQAKTSEERQAHAKEILRSRKYRELYPLKNSQSNYLIHWYYIPIRELVGLKAFKEDYSWIAKKLAPKISPAEAKHAVDELLKLGLLSRKPDGKLQQTDAIISVGDQITSSLMIYWHKEMMRKAAESLDTCPRDRRDISTATVSVSLESLNKVKEMIQKCRRDILNLCAADANTDVVYQLNFQVFPLTDEASTGEPL